MSVVKILAIRNTACDNYRIGAIWVLSVLIPSLNLQYSRIDRDMRGPCLRAACAETVRACTGGPCAVERRWRVSKF